MDMLQQKNWMECPSCHDDQHSCHVDGNNKLYRYKSAGNKRLVLLYSFLQVNFYQFEFIYHKECVGVVRIVYNISALGHRSIEIYLFVIRNVWKEQ